MSNGEQMAEAMAEMAQSVLATPNHRRRLKSDTFWERLGCKRRTPERVEQVRGLLEHHHMSVTLRHRGSMDELTNVPFGSEDKNDWVVIIHKENAAVPSTSPQTDANSGIDTIPLDSWFEKLAQRSYRSENEVVQWFLTRLLEQLGYEEPDFALQHPVTMYFGTEKFVKQADVVLFKRDDHITDSHNPDNTLIVAEAKKVGKPIDADVVGQASSYAMRVSPVYYILTNGDDVEVYLYQMTLAKDVHAMPPFKRANLKQKWSELYKLLCKKRVLEIKEKRRQFIAELKESCAQTVEAVCNLPVSKGVAQPSANAAAQ